MILGNYAQQNRNCVMEKGKAFSNPFSQFKPQVFNNFYTPDTVLTDLDKSAFNHGYNTHHAWNLALKSGGLGATGEVRGLGTLAVDALAVKLAEAALTGDGTLTALGGLIVQALADLTGTGTVTSANLQAFLAAVASLTGSGTISAALATGLGALLMDATGSGTLALTAAALGELDADLTVTGTGLSTANVGQAVWSAIASANNVTGTMGEKLNDAGSASNPWTEVIESGFTAAEILRILLAVQAGKTTISGSDVSFRDVDDTKDRVFAEMTGSERTTVTLDGS